MARPLSLQCRGMSSVQIVKALEGRRYVLHGFLSSFVKEAVHEGEEVSEFAVLRCLPILMAFMNYWLMNAGLSFLSPGLCEEM